MIESYDFGEIEIDGKTYTSDVIIYSDKIETSWWRKTSHKLAPDDLPDQVLKEKPDLILIGTGYYGYMKVLPETKELIESKGINLLIEDTKKAYHRFNEQSKKEKVIALLHLTC